MFIDDEGRLGEAIDGFSVAGRWSLDTEFVRERTYLPRLCLIQLAVPGRILLVDALPAGVREFLERLFRSDRRPKALHAARQDIEALLPLTGEPLAPVFDTQVAAALLGFPSQVGYAELVRQLLGVELAKGHARTDWAARPLSAEQLAYAADDVRYLGPVAEELESRLVVAGRLPWLEEDCRALADPSLYRVEPAEAWRRLKGLERLRPEELAVARALAAWREERALHRNLPRGWILADESIRELARRRPGTAAGLRDVPGLQPGAAVKLAEPLLALIRDAPVQGVDDLADRVVERLTPEQQAAVRRLQDALQALSLELGIGAEVLATRRELATLVRGGRDIPALRGWRRDVVGPRLLAAI
jgi:ribonuclease D